GGFDIVGYVRNLPDGRVELLAQGHAAEIDRYLDAISNEMGGFIKNVAFHVLLPSQTRLEIFSRPLAFYHLLGLPSLVRKSRILNGSERLSSLEYLLPPVPFAPLRSKLKAVTPAKGAKKHRVSFFLGCAHNLVFQAATIASISLLTDNSCEVVTPKNECCGMPCLGYGEMEEARKMARHNIDAFGANPDDVIITGMDVQWRESHHRLPPRQGKNTSHFTL
ncbi:MAG: heterodisulfide reductase-related iron-sulfur binding cluster, partial [Desulfomonilia bacterium]